MKTLPSQLNLAKQVHGAIVADIVEGKLRPGERIIQEQIADLLGVSRQPVQQALLLLRTEGLLHDRPGRGLIVAPLDLARVRHMYDVRAVVEGLAFRKAAVINSERARRLGPALLEKGRKAVASGSVSAMLGADTTLHNFIYDLANNPLIAPTLHAQWAYTQRVMGQVLMRDETPRRIWDQHERMLEAVIAADGDEAERLAREHILESADFMIARLRNGHDGAVDDHVSLSQPNGPFSLPLGSAAAKKAAAARRLES
jgi:DNA-binding GntR family transcriptional regulator